MNLEPCECMYVLDVCHLSNLSNILKECIRSILSKKCVKKLLKTRCLLVPQDYNKLQHKFIGKLCKQASTSIPLSYMIANLSTHSRELKK